MVKFKCEVVWGAEKGNCKAVAIYGADESNIQFWLKHKV
jgi:hypothetical protein